MKNKYLKVILLSLLMSCIMIVPQIIKGDGILSIYADFNYQQIPFAYAANAAIKDGNTTYNWINDLGTSFIGSYSFYNLGSIFFLISLLFPAKLFPYLIGPLLILKYVVAALLAYIYIERYVKNKDYAVIGALLYSFSGFQITNMMFNHFHDVVALFPLLLIALDKTMYENKKGLFALSVAINAITNYFFFVGQVVFLILYFIIKLIMKDYKITWKKFFTLAIESLLGVGIAAIIFIPSVLFVLENPRVGASWTLIEAIKPSCNQLLEILRGMIFAPEIMSQRGLYNEFLFTSTELYLPFVGIVLFASFMWKNKKSWITLLLLTSLIFMLIPILNSTFFAFNTAYYSRWFYMPILIMALASAKSLEENIKLEHGYLGVGIILTLITLLTLRNSLRDYQIVYHLSYFLMNLLIALFGYIGLYFVFKFKKHQKLFPTLIIIGIVISNTLTGYFTFYKYNKLLSPTQYNEMFLSNDLKFDYLQDGERTDSNNSISYNLGYILTIPNLKNFNSTVSGSIFAFNNGIGIDRHVQTIYSEKYPKVRDFLSVKYIIASASEKMDLPIKETTQYYNVYENTTYVSMGIPYKYYINKSEFEKLDSNTRQDLLVYAVVLDNKQIKKYQDILTEIDLSQIDKLNKKYEEYISKLNKKTATDFTYRKTGATFNINSSEDNFIVLTIPYDKGWKIYANNKEVAYENVDNGLIGIKIKKGNNNVEMIYNTPGQNIGIIITIASLSLLIIYLLLIKTKKLDI